ncbi:NAD(P)/FAD-dependent oxidoreductase [Nonomuraea sp. NPDC049400]|uniref:NAD(P)/FAD-dependent oxidoreductase n=1 Tax=Nonomuraea sp. NPDC049400 TaxID=3364352 RepID=UPI00378F0CDC
MSDRADVVVVGGGVMGCLLALHLVEQGVERVRLLERDGVFQGTSAAGGGFLSGWAAYPPETASAGYALDFYEKTQAAGHDIGFRRNGTLYVAADERSWQGLRMGAEGNVLVDPARIAELTNDLVAGDRVVGGLLDPNGAHVHPPLLGAALAELFLARGGVIDTRRPVTGLRLNGERVVAVDTPTGLVECDDVVLATGAWSNRLLEPLGAFLPLAPRLTSRITTGPIGIPESLPTLIVMGVIPGNPAEDIPLWLRGQDGALLWGGTYRSYPRDILLDAEVPDRLDEIPLDGVMQVRRVGEQAASFIPVLGQATSIRLKHGAPCYTPDGRALVGQVPGLTGLHVLTGDNEAGITFGPGYARVLAEFIAHGEADQESLDAWQVDRFGGSFTSESEVIKAFQPRVTA